MVTVTTVTVTTTTTSMIPLQDPLKVQTSSTMDHPDQVPEQLPFDHTSITLPSKSAPKHGPTTCLFCNAESISVDKNYQHMHKQHGFRIPDRHHLIIELEPLLEYMQLIVLEHKECLFCHTSRRTEQAVQQHMADVGHCNFDISKENSEFRDFYDYESESSTSESSDEAGSDSDQQLQLRGAVYSSEPVQVDDSSIRLPSGKIISNRATPSARHPSRKPLQPPTTRARGNISLVEQPARSRSASPDDKSDDKPQSTSKALEKQDRKAAALQVQLASLRQSDQQALAHLPASEQRVILAQSLRSAARLQRSERKFRGQMDKQGNVASKERLVIDVPGGSRKHKNRFMAV